MRKRERPSATNDVCTQHRVDAKAVERARSTMISSAILNRAAEAFRVLGHAGRLKVLEALDRQELCVCDLSEILGLSMSGTSQQLRELRRLGAIDYRVSGKFAYYRLADRSWLALARSVMQRVGPVETSAMESKQAV